jgi:hypothetical protein
MPELEERCMQMTLSGTLWQTPAERFFGRGFEHHVRGNFN